MVDAFHGNFRKRCDESTALMTQCRKGPIKIGVLGAGGGFLERGFGVGVTGFTNAIFEFWFFERSDHVAVSLFSAGAWVWLAAVLSGSMNPFASSVRPSRATLRMRPLQRRVIQYPTTSKSANDLQAMSVVNRSGGDDQGL